MKIAIDASRAFLKQRTGIEEYAYQVVKHLRDKLSDHQVTMFVRENDSGKIDFKLPDNWEVRELQFARGWTQIGLSLEMFLRPVDALFVPAHTTPLIHPKKTTVVIHGLEYELCPEAYSRYSRWFHRFFIRRSCAWSKKIIAVSKNTKRVLKKIYDVSQSKIKVVYNGFETSYIPSKITGKVGKSPYLFFVSRLERRKNVIGILKTFEILKEKYGYKGELILAGNPGFGYEEIESFISKSNFKKEIIQVGFVSEKKKWELLKKADIFMFPSLCEGFGIPVLEAQYMGTPVITSKEGPLDEVAGNKNILVDPNNQEKMAELANKMICDKKFREGVIKKGLENVKRFSWDSCAEEIAKEILKG